jgi:glycerol-3-phosphate dehydrogenase
MAAEPVDLFVIGGGVNGVGIARDAAGRGLSVVLAEQGDLGGATSSSSTKLIHGGLRYLEHYEFRLVREALMEREVLLRMAPHIIWPLRFVLPHDRSMRPAWLLRLGLILYDNLGGRDRLPGSKGLDLTHGPEGAPLRPEFVRGFAYSDCWVEDNRLVVMNAMDAAARGARIETRTRCVRARRDGDAWAVEMQPVGGGETETVRARGLVNAAGPWVGQVLNGTVGSNAKHAVRLVKGSHVVVPRMYAGDHAYIFQNPDRRIVFAIPYEGRFTLVGTTDVDYRGDPAAVAIDADETAYLCEAVSRYFRTPVTPADVVWTYSGVRPLLDDESGDASKVTRDYTLELDAPEGQAPLLSIFGGKITTFRRLAEDATGRIARALGHGAGPWTAGAILPGGDMPGADFDAFVADLQRRRPWLPAFQARRLARAHGTLIDVLLGDAGGEADLGRRFGDIVYEAELRHAAQYEWVRTGADFLWRRSKLGLHLAPDACAAVDAWFAARFEAGRSVCAVG